MGKNTENCVNFLTANCDPRIKENYMSRKIEPGQGIHYIDAKPETLKKEAEICNNCLYFKQNKDYEEYEEFRIYSHPRQNEVGLWYPWVRILPPKGNATILSGTAADIGAFRTEDEAKDSGFELGKLYISKLR